MDFGRLGAQRQGKSKVAALAVGMVRTRTVGLIVVGRGYLAAGLVLVLVVAEVRFGGSTGFVCAVRRRRAPDHLQRYDKQKECEQPTAHPLNFRFAVAQRQLCAYGCVRIRLPLATFRRLAQTPSEVQSINALGSEVASHGTDKISARTNS